MTSEALDWAPDACTLPSVERPLREAEFADLFASSLLRVERAAPMTARLGLTLDSTDRARDLEGSAPEGRPRGLPRAFPGAEGGRG